jgi:hypothetical protein
MEDLQQVAKKGLTRDALLDLFVNAPDEIYINTMVGMVRGGLDYEFFQILSQRIESAKDDEEKTKLIDLREFLLDITKQMDEELQQEKKAAQEVLEKIISEPSVEIGLEKYGNELNDFFVEAVKEGLEAARKSGDLDRISKLGKLDAMIEEANKPPAELQFVEELLKAPDANAIKEILNQKPEVLTDEFVQLLANLINQTEQQGNQQALVEKLNEIQKVATKAIMAKNLRG